MPAFVNRLRANAPDSFLAALLMAAGLAMFLVVDQAHWWQLKAEYAFGWLVPVFVGYVLLERWPRFTAAFRGAGVDPLVRGWRISLGVAAAAAMTLGTLAFLLGALYRAGLGVTQPGSLALALGFSGLLLGMIYFNTPVGVVGDGPVPTGWRALPRDARLRVTALFLFPALIWMLSAPLVDAIENQLSLFLLRKVTAVVFTLFNALGYPLVQQGNVLVLPQGEVQVAEACSGIRSLTACLFAGSFLAAVFLDRLWKKVALFGLAAVLAFFTNLLRSLFLTGWAYAHGSESIEGAVHDLTGYAVLGLTCVGLLSLLPLFKAETWLRWLAPREGGAAQP